MQHYLISIVIFLSSFSPFINSNEYKTPDYNRNSTIQSDSFSSIIEKMALFLSSDTLNKNNLINYLDAKIIDEPDAPLPISLNSKLLKTKVKLFLYKESGLPFALTIPITTTDNLTLKKLKTIWGDYSKSIRYGLESNYEYIFYYTIDSKTKYGIIATINNKKYDSGNFENIPLNELSFRLDHLCCKEK